MGPPRPLSGGETAMDTTSAMLAVSNLNIIRIFIVMAFMIMVFVIMAVMIMVFILISIIVIF